MTGPLTAVSAQDVRKDQGGSGRRLRHFELNADRTSEGAAHGGRSLGEPVLLRRRLARHFVAHNDEMALGVRQALRETVCFQPGDLPLGGALITGCDGSQTFGQRLVREGRLKATVSCRQPRARPSSGSPRRARAARFPGPRDSARDLLSRPVRPETIDHLTCNLLWFNILH